MAAYLRLAGIVVILLLSGLAGLVRWGDLAEGVGAENMEAPYHVLHTLHSLDQGSWRNHYYLPSVTLGRERDKGISWGATVPTTTGDYIYTSFPPLGFMLPYAALGAAGADFSLRNLALLNMVLGAISAVVLSVFLFELAEWGGASPRLSFLSAFGGALIAVFSREVLQSHGMIYWSHSLYQVVLGFSLLFLLLYKKDGGNILYKAGFLVTVLLGPMIEWTAYVFNAGVAAALWLGFLAAGPGAKDAEAPPEAPAGESLPDDRRLAVAVMATTLAAGLLIFLHFVIVLGFKAAALAFLSRFLARSGLHSAFPDLVGGYGLSYGFFFVIVLAMLFAAYAVLVSGGTLRVRHRKVIGAIFLVSAIPLLENLLMLQHAATFSFDRLKFIFPAGIIVSLALVTYPRWGRVVVVLALVAACGGGIRDYRRSIRDHAVWAEIHRSNLRIARMVLEKVDPACTTFAASRHVRGYLNGLFGVGIYEKKAFEDLGALMAERRGCAGVFIEQDMVFTDMPRLERVIIVLPDGGLLEVV